MRHSIRLVVAGVDLLREKNLVGWLVADADLVREKNIVGGWLTSQTNRVTHAGTKFGCLIFNSCCLNLPVRVLTCAPCQLASLKRLILMFLRSVTTAMILHDGGLTPMAKPANQTSDTAPHKASSDQRRR